MRLLRHLVRSAKLVLLRVGRFVLEHSGHDSYGSGRRYRVVVNFKSKIDRLSLGIALKAVKNCTSDVTVLLTNVDMIINYCFYVFFKTVDRI